MERQKRNEKREKGEEDKWKGRGKVDRRQKGKDGKKQENKEGRKGIEEGWNRGEGEIREANRTGKRRRIRERR